MNTEVKTAMTIKHKRTATVLSAMALFSGMALAQDVRGLGMGGALLPGPGLAQYNPAYSVYPPAPGSSITLPLGLLNLFLRPQLSPLTLLNASGADLSDPNKGFDGLAFFDQFTHLNEFILNPPSSPKSITVDVNNAGFVIRDENGNIIDLSGSAGGSTADVRGASGIPSIFNVPFSVGPVALGIGVYAGTSGPVLTPDAALKKALAGGGLTPNTTYTLNAKGSASSTVGVSVAFATPLDIPAIDTIPAFTLYLGARGNGFFGLAYADADVTGSIKTDANSQPDTKEFNYNGKVFLSYVGQGSGFGVSADLGVAADVQGVSVGIGILGAINYSVWNGTTYTITNGKAVDPVAESKYASNVNPLFTLNGAYTFTPEGFPGTLLVSGDAQFGRGAFAGHVGVEAGFDGMLFARAGIGYASGLRFGIGAGVVFLPGFGMDLALTTHTAPFTNHFDFGIAAALRFGF